MNFQPLLLTLRWLQVDDEGAVHGEEAAVVPLPRLGGGSVGIGAQRAGLVHHHFLDGVQS